MKIRRRSFSQHLFGALCILFLLVATWAPASAQADVADPLPSWNDGPTKQAILGFVAEVADEDGSSYVPPAERVAVLDNDGTLWTEQPVPVQAAFVIQRVADLALEHPEWATTQPYQTFLEQNLEALRSLSPKEIEQVLLDTLQPPAVWQNFYALTQIPRGSHHEEQVRDFLAQFGRNLGLETIVDEVGNVIIRKPAGPGMEDLPGVILQAHMDMVPQKTPESTHDFLTDPIHAYVDGNWIVADGTTLGADDGIGVAMAMAVLQSETPPLGPIEALFTINEEDGMDGALGLQPGLLQGSILINLDSEDEGVFTIGSAGGEYAGIETSYAESDVPADVTAYQVIVGGLKGGHSGVDINRSRGHAIKLLVRLLDEAATEHDLRLAQLAGGAAGNAIPRDATARVVVPTAQVDLFLAGVEDFQATVRRELALVEPGLSLQAVPADLPDKVMDEEFQRLLIDLLYATPQGVMRMSDAVPALVETSTNLGIVNAADGQLAVTSLSRSSMDSQLADVSRMIAGVWNLADIDVTLSGKYSGWNPNPDSPILLLLQDAYQELYGQKPKVMAVHAGLECGTIVSKYSGMDAISIGPTLQNVHSPGERLEIATVDKVYDLLLQALTTLAPMPPAQP